MTISTASKRLCSCIPQRYVIALLCFFGLFNAYAMRGCLSIAITEMVGPSKKTQIMNEEYCFYDNVIMPKINSSDENGSSEKSASKETYNWSEYTQGLILSSFYCGYVFANLPSGFIADKYGGKHTFGFGMLITIILTILTPTAIYIGDSTALVIVRAIMGVGGGITYAPTNALLSKWVPPEERSRTASFVYASVMIGTIFGTVVSGWILQYSDVGWPLVFYVMGAIGAVWYLIWMFLCYDSPQEHPFITQEELDYLKEKMIDHTHGKPSSVPWRHILASKRMWALTIAMIGFNWMNFSIITDLSKYMSGVLKFSVENNGYFSSVIFLCTWLGANTTSWLVDYLVSKKNISTTLVRKIGSVIAMPISAAFLVAASYAGCDRVLVIGMFAVSMALKGCAFPSIVTNSLDLSPNYAGMVAALTNGMAAWTGIVGPYIIGVFTPNQTLAEWRLVFWIMFAVASLANLVFVVFGSGDVQYWNDLDCTQAKVEINKRQTNESTTKYY